MKKKAATAGTVTAYDPSREIGIKMNTTPTADLSSSAESARRIAPELAALIARHSGEPVGHSITLQPGDPLYIAETARVERRLPIATAQPFVTLFSTDLYGFDGSQLRWRDFDHAFPARVFPGVTFTGEMNSAFIGDGYVAVGRGRHTYIGEDSGEWVYAPTLDPMTEVGQFAAARAHDEAGFLEKHAEQVKAHRPAWATEVTAELDEEWFVSYAATVGKVTISAEVTASGPDAWTATKTVVIVDVMDSVLTADEASVLARDLIEASRIITAGVPATTAIPRSGCERHPNGTHGPCDNCELARVARVEWMTTHAEKPGQASGGADSDA